jgi:hypothetical protein
MLSFNEAISNLGVEELKLYENKFTWTNKQESSLLERLTDFFPLLGFLIIQDPQFGPLVGTYLTIALV